MWIILAAATLTYGLEYYLTPLVERPFTPGHELLKPAGLIGQGYGVIGTLFILLGVASYALRKRVVRTNRVGKLKYWLESHIFLCTLGPFLILLHTSFRFGGLVSIAFWSMVIVVASGVFGRYVFVRIPQTINGRFRSLQEAQQEREQLLGRLQDEFGVGAEQLAVVLGGGSTTAPRNLIGSLWFAVQFDLRRRGQSRKVSALLAESGVPAGLRGSASSLIRKDAFSRIKPKNHERMQVALKAGLVTILWSTSVIAIEPERVIMQNGRAQTGVIRNDYAFIFAGGELPTKFLRDCGVEIDTKFGDP